MSHRKDTHPVTESDDDKAVKLAEKVLDLMESLTTVMEQEIELLMSKDYAAMETIRKDKLRITKDYQIHMALIADNDNGLKSISGTLRGRLKEVGLKLARLSERNAVMLKSAITGTQAFLQTVMQAAQKQCRNMESYGDPRKTQAATLGSYSPVVNPVAVDRTA